MIDVRPATPGDDAEIRALLRDSPMQSWVSMTSEREPSFLGSLNRFGRDHAMVGRQGGALAGMYVSSEHLVHVNGRATRLGYLGGLRVARAFRHRLGLLREGYASVRTVGDCAAADHWYTCIASDNRAARRVLEAGLRGLPRYWPAGEIVGLVICRSRGQRNGLWREPAMEERAAICTLHNESARRFQYSPVLAPATIDTAGLRFMVAGAADRIHACMALWDQRHYKQLVARAYRQPLAALRPLYNAWARIGRRVALPAPGCALDQCFLSFFHARDPGSSDIVALVADALAACPTQVMSLGVHAGDPALPALMKSFRPLCYRMTVYSVRYGSPFDLDGRPVRPELGVL